MKYAQRPIKQNTKKLFKGSILKNEMMKFFRTFHEHTMSKKQAQESLAAAMSLNSFCLSNYCLSDFKLQLATCNLQL